LLFVFWSFSISLSQFIIKDGFSSREFTLYVVHHIIDPTATIFRRALKASHIHRSFLSFAITILTKPQIFASIPLLEMHIIKTYHI